MRPPATPAAEHARTRPSRPRDRVHHRASEGLLLGQRGNLPFQPGHARSSPNARPPPSLPNQAAAPSPIHELVRRRPPEPTRPVCPARPRRFLSPDRRRDQGQHPQSGRAVESAPLTRRQIAAWRVSGGGGGRSARSAHPPTARDDRRPWKVGSGSRRPSAPSPESPFAASSAPRAGGPRSPGSAPVAVDHAAAVCPGRRRADDDALSGARPSVMARACASRLQACAIPGRLSRGSCHISVAGRGPATA